MVVLTPDHPIFVYSTAELISPRSRPKKTRVETLTPASTRVMSKTLMPSKGRPVLPTALEYRRSPYLARVEETTERDAKDLERKDKLIISNLGL